LFSLIYSYQDAKMVLKCRFYRRKYPRVDEVVMANVVSVTNVLIHVQLPQYDNIQGIVLLSEVSRRRIRSINNHLRVGTKEPLIVVNVDEEHGNIDLSKRRISSQSEVEACEAEYAKRKTIASILGRVAELLKYESEEQLEALVAKTAWHFDVKHIGGAYQAFSEAVADPSIFDACGLEKRTQEVLVSTVQSRMIRQAVTVRGLFEINCYTYEGIDAIKHALKKGLEWNCEEYPLSINLVKSPLYKITITTLDSTGGVRFINDVLAAVREAIESRSGKFTLVMAPNVDDGGGVDEADKVEEYCDDGAEKQDEDSGYLSPPDDFEVEHEEEN